MENKKQKKEKGFTLIEFLIYSGIVVFVIGALTLAGTNVLQARVRVIAMEEINRNASLSLEKIAYLIRNSEGVNSAIGSSLSLQMSSPSDNPTEIFLEEDYIAISRGGVVGRLTTSSVKVSSLSFNEFLDGAVRVNVVFEFHNPSAREEFAMNREFKITENVRNR
jgi:type II secretory pathway pseudopilin PulG